MFGNIFKYISDSSLITRKTPEFWHKDCLTAQILIPITVVYFLIKRLVTKKVEARKFPFKIICVGNAVVGGAGKTPTAIAIHEILKKKNPSAKIAFVTTAYKSRLEGPLVVNGPSDLILETPNFYLRPFAPGDGALLINLFSDTEVRCYVSGADTSEKIRKKLEFFIQHQRRHGYSNWAVFEKNTDVFAGYAGGLEFDGGQIEIGYCLKRAFWGKGCATELASGVRDYFFRNPQLKKICAFTNMENSASQRVLEKIGMLPKGQKLYRYNDGTERVSSYFEINREEHNNFVILKNPEFNNLITKRHTAQDVGDEALMLSSYGQTIICKDRIQALEFAEGQGVDIVILDDGLHDKRIHKDTSFLVIDGKYGFGNNLLFPAGPLRDRLDFAVDGADHVIMIGKDERSALKMIKYATKKEYPVIESYIDVLGSLDKTQVYVAFAGIGRPEKFFNMLTEMGFVLADKIGFADHHFYTKHDIETLEGAANAQKAKLICTEKDFVKLPPDFAAKVECVKISLKFETKEIQEIL